MMTSDRKNYRSPTITLCQPGYSHCSGELTISVAAHTTSDGTDAQAAVLSIRSGGAHMQLYPTFDQLDALIEAAEAAKVALAERIAADAGMEVQP
ncbi:hypothetical protein [Thiomonas sp.]|jgi:uncharacterized SAM-binding protein YcdF (DUF218 family)|uniref:hypothetical protein n=1 Tax=Thiomonas sp. TaxID=2047785 RepID=UPI002590354D|nr:hypothetical protein [Thiomonas sp.]